MMDLTIWLLAITALLGADATPIQHPVDNSGSSGLVCRKAKWTDLILFFLMNFVTHAFTVKSRPGETHAAAAIYNTSALLLPFTGVIRAVDAIGRASIFGKDALQKAVRARALVVVGRSMDWKPTYIHDIDKSHGITAEIIGLGQSQDYQEYKGDTHLLVDANQFSRLQILPCEKVVARKGEVNIHGQCHLPAGYELIILPVKAAVIPIHSSISIDLASSYNTAKAAAAIAQVIFAVVTLYKSRGDQLMTFGYAAYSITVIPYALMSIVNLISNVLTPDYESLYLIRSSVMDEAEARGGRFSGMVGCMAEEKYQVETRRRLEYPFRAADLRKWRFSITGDANIVSAAEYEDVDIPSAPLEMKQISLNGVSSSSAPTILIPNIGKILKYKSKTWIERCLRVLEWFVILASLMTPYILIWWLTGFKSEASTGAQRGWVVSWIVLGQIGGAFVAYWFSTRDSWRARLWTLFFGSFLLIPSFGGFVTVAETILRNEICTEV